MKKIKTISIFIMLVSIFSVSASHAEWFWNKKKDQKLIISGKAVIPVEKIKIYIYKEGTDLHGPYYAVSEPTDPEGNFNIELPEGTYFFVARKRTSGDDSGPLVQGDIKSNFIGPIKIKNGEPINLNFNCFTKQGDEKTTGAPLVNKTTGISGTIRDADGNTVAGVRIHVYTFIQMSERPKFVSAKTSPDGKYIIYLPEGGTYYLCARDRFGGPSKIGDLYGRYDQGTINPSAIVVRD
ncbi:carboxypeptidase regulatory-like domain-containing protein, partial [Candidatus Desantisbacteria bacterium]|nr:carboxypeptidase regulatory-like domain-containing protein [Candidatus Desantisbacteria bacterium]